MVDARLLGGAPGSWTVENLFAGLLTHEDIQFWRYRDDGPPPGTPQLTSTPSAGRWRSPQDLVGPVPAGQPYPDRERASRDVRGRPDDGQAR